MTRSMGDAVTAGYLPSDLDMYAGYLDGKYQSYNQIKALFPGKLVVAIATQTSTDAGEVFDGPPDNGTWPGVVDWVIMRRAHGADPSVNTTGGEWANGVQAFNAARVAQPHWWISSWNGQETIPAGAIAHQYANVSNRYDLSVVADYWPGVDPAPTTKPPTKPPVATPTGPAGPAPIDLAEEEDVILVQVTPTATDNPGIYLLSGSLYAHIPTLPDASAFEGGGVKNVNISYAQHQSLLAAAAALQGKLAGSLAITGNLTAS